MNCNITANRSIIIFKIFIQCVYEINSNNLTIKFEMAWVYFNHSTFEWVHWNVHFTVIIILARKQLLNSEIRFSQGLSNAFPDIHSTANAAVSFTECQRCKAAHGTNRRWTAVAVAVALVLEITMTKVVAVFGQWQ